MSWAWTTRDFPYAVITPAAILGDYKPLDKDKPSISADIQPGDKIYGPVIAALVEGVEPAGEAGWTCRLFWAGQEALSVTVTTTCANLHNGDLVAYNTKRGAICTLDDLHAQQAEFPHCIPDGIFILHEDCKPGDDLKPVMGAGRPRGGVRDHPQPPRLPLRHRPGPGGRRHL